MIIDPKTYFPKRFEDKVTIPLKRYEELLKMEAAFKAMKRA